MLKASIGSESLPLKEIGKESIREMERSVILEALRANQWNRRRTAESPKISYRALIYKIRNAGLLSRRVENLASRPEKAGGPSTSSAD
jgi:DNA-binding NtrC family response regulator